MWAFHAVVLSALRRCINVDKYHKYACTTLTQILPTHQGWHCPRTTAAAAAQHNQALYHIHKHKHHHQALYQTHTHKHCARTPSQERHSSLVPQQLLPPGTIRHCITLTQTLRTHHHRSGSSLVPQQLLPPSMIRHCITLTHKHCARAPPQEMQYPSTTAAAATQHDQALHNTHTDTARAHHHRSGSSLAHSQTLRMRTTTGAAAA